MKSKKKLLAYLQSFFLLLVQLVNCKAYTNNGQQYNPRIKRTWIIGSPCGIRTAITTTGAAWLGERYQGYQ